MSTYDDLRKQIAEQNEQLKQIFEALRQSLTIAEESISTRSAKIMANLEPITKMLEINGNMANELGTTVNNAIKQFSAQQTEMEKLAEKILPNSIIK